MVESWLMAFPFRRSFLYINELTRHLRRRPPYSDDSDGSDSSRNTRCRESLRDSEREPFCGVTNGTKRVIVISYTRFDAAQFPRKSGAGDGPRISVWPDVVTVHQWRPTLANVLKEPRTGA